MCGVQKHSPTLPLQTVLLSALPCFRAYTPVFPTCLRPVKVSSTSCFHHLGSEIRPNNKGPHSPASSFSVITALPGQKCPGAWVVPLSTPSPLPHSRVSYVFIPSWEKNMFEGPNGSGTPLVGKVLPTLRKRPIRS